MSSSTRTAFYALSGIVLVGTLFSLLQNTYLDTSNPLLTHLPHPLHKSHYWANKRTWLNVYFIKRAWGWTSAAFILAWTTGPPSARSLARLSRWVTATATWLLFTAWFFGPALFDRILLASGGECLLSLPDGSFLPLTPEYCHARTALSPETHPALFASQSNSLTTTSFPAEWRTTPRLRKGHDVSGHIYLLTLSVLLLAQQLGPSFALTRWSPPHTLAVIGNCALILLWLFASGTTSVYFHSPQEKISGYLLGLVCFAVSQLPAQLVYSWTKPAEKLHTS